MNTLDVQPARLLRSALLLVLGLVLFDACWWNLTRYTPGLSVPVFFVGCAVLTVFARRSDGLSFRARLLLFLLGGSVIAGAINTSCTNTISFFLLTFALAAELQFPALEQFAERCHAQFRALLLAPFRLLRFLGQLFSTLMPSHVGARQRLSHRIVWSILVLAVGLVFGGLLAGGNAVFNHWTGAFFTWLGQVLVQIFYIERLFFWLIGAILFIPLLWPSPAPENGPPRLLNLPRFSEKGAESGLWPSYLSLILFNLIFLCGNAADLLYLWAGEGLPVGVTYAQFVHEGTISLIVAVLLSALVLTLVFQQAPNVAGRRDLKLLAHVWIAQNLFLIASVSLRLKLYIEAYNMTVLRLGLLIFLLLVVAGYVLLAVKIQKEKSLAWLLGGAICAVFFTFYLTQFLNLGGWSADYNVRRWEQDPSRNLDVCYLAYLGPAAWPALDRACAHDPDVARQYAARFNVGAERPDQPPSLDNWRTWSYLAWRNRWTHTAPGF